MRLLSLQWKSYTGKRPSLYCAGPLVDEAGVCGWAGGMLTRWESSASGGKACGGDMHGPISI